MVGPKVRSDALGQWSGMVMEHARQQAKYHGLTNGLTEMSKEEAGLRNDFNWKFCRPSQPSQPSSSTVSSKQAEVEAEAAPPAYTTDESVYLKLGKSVPF